jgi:hypothetical protein
VLILRSLMSKQELILDFRFFRKSTGDVVAIKNARIRWIGLVG